MAKKKTPQQIVPAAEFKAKCLAVMDEVEATGEPVTITKYGRPVAQLVAVRERPTAAFGRMRGWVTAEHDIVSPVDVEWDANRA